MRSILHILGFTKGSSGKSILKKLHLHLPQQLHTNFLPASIEIYSGKKSLRNLQIIFHMQLVEIRHEVIEGIEGDEEDEEYIEEEVILFTESMPVEEIALFKAKARKKINFQFLLPNDEQIKKEASNYPSHWQFHTSVKADQGTHKTTWQSVGF